MRLPAAVWRESIYTASLARTLWRLRHVIDEHPDCFGLGIDRQTAVVIQHGQLRIVGDSYVATLVPVPAPEDERIDFWRPGEQVDLRKDVFEGE